MTTKAYLLKTMKLQCQECMGSEKARKGEDSQEAQFLVKDCTAPDCSLFPFRFGKDPHPNKNKSRAAKKRYLSDATGLKGRNENRRSAPTEYQPADQKEIDENLDVFLVPD